jgi:hypothetical protein
MDYYQLNLPRKEIYLAVIPAMNPASIQSSNMSSSPNVPSNPFQGFLIIINFIKIIKYWREEV